jgi:hypothetical protein
MKKLKNPYPRISELKIKVYNKPIDHVISGDVQVALLRNGLSVEKFHEFFGVQTCLLREDGKRGLYSWDVESVLERMMSGKLIGTQKDWD